MANDDERARLLKESLVSNVDSVFRELEPIIAKEKEYFNDYILLKSNYTTAKKEYLVGKIHFAEFSLNETKIKAGLIDFIDNIHISGLLKSHNEDEKTENFKGSDEASLKKDHNPKYQEETLNKLINLTKIGLLPKAKEVEVQELYQKFLLTPPFEKERYDAAALKIAEIEEDEDLLWSVTKNQKGPGAFFLYKAMFPEGKYLDAANKQIEKILKEQAPGDLAPITLTEDQHFDNLSYQGLSEEEYFTLTSYLSFCQEKRFYLEDVMYWGWWKWYLNAVVLLLVPVSIACLYSFLMQEPFFEYSVSRALLTIGAFLLFFYTSVRIYGSFSLLQKDWKSLMEADKFFRKASAFLKAGFISNDAKRVWNIITELYRMDQKLHTIEHKNIMHYLLPEKPEKPGENSSQETK
ncbi:MAG: hypothetical protein J5I94_20365 [Phaeodactylibacter sp.]|nr:hypothetical protein [Phaeodactylibacter sp.]